MSGSGVAFSHPSIYESVAVAVGNKDPLFAAQEFPISVIMQKCKVHVPQEGETEMYILFSESSSAMDALVQRLAAEIRQGKYFAIQHELCWERKFCEERRNYVGINQRDSADSTILHVAVQCRNYTACKILLERGANVIMSLTKDTSLTILHELVGAGDVDILDLCLQHGADVDYSTDEGVTLLHCCVEWLRGPRCIDMIVLLLGYGAKIKKADGSIKTAIRRAAPYFFGDVGYIKSIAYGKTALHYACRKHGVDVNVVRLLIDRGAAVNQVDGNDSWETLVDYLCEKNGIGKEELEAARRPFEGRHQGAETEEMEAITLLLERGADVEKTNKYGQAPLHLLCQRCLVDVRTVHLLLKHGAGVNVADKVGNTPVHYICQRKEADVSTLYLLTGRSVKTTCTLKNRHGRTALQYLCERQRIRLAETFHLT
ncbi:poly [ADP-ribose] polymerase tankyrase-2-like [Haliotis rubra]|uniref:poly [ADP-ribose] polymerase tankyrase-2-like n=1 Tax=Haliotis rubra TaxID=36100 RepID=UPI001EE5A4FB|nr:poly [ADP-ribose] polymerase tankyrase-2-like [Haliotis rubra]